MADEVTLGDAQPLRRFRWTEDLERGAEHLYYAEGYTFQQVAEALACSKGAVVKLWQRRGWHPRSKTPTRRLRDGLSALRSFGEGLSGLEASNAQRAALQEPLSEPSPHMDVALECPQCSGGIQINACTLFSHVYGDKTVWAHPAWCLSCGWVGRVVR